MFYQFLPVDRIYYGINAVSENIIFEIKGAGLQKALVVTTNSLLQTNVYRQFITLLNKHQIDMYVISVKQHVPGNVLMKNINDIRNFQPDFIISCGGGSPIDAGKILSFVLAEGIVSEADLYPYSENLKEKDIERTTLIPHFTIPTTLSAAEFTSIAGVTNSENQLKYKFSHINMTPKIVFLDPSFTIETPEWLWLSTGMRAVDHAVETLYSPNPNPINTSLALQALEKLYNHLPLCKEQPLNLESRLECQIGAWMSLFSVVNIKLGLSHSIGHQIGALYDIPHGMTSAIMLPHVMKLLLSRTSDEQAQITRLLSDNNQPAHQLINGLIKKLEIPHRLRDFNVSSDSVPSLINHILVDIKSEKNDFVLSTKNLETDIKMLIEAAW